MKILNSIKIVAHHTIIFLALFFLFGNKATAQRPSLHFKHYTTSNGLSQNMVDCMLQDSKGFLWFGTWNGLNRFDGYSFHVFRKDNQDNNSLTDNFIVTLCEDQYKNIWVGTRNGLCVYIYEKDCFVQYKQQATGENILPSNSIISLTLDADNNLWIGTENGLNVCEILDKDGKLRPKIAQMLENPSENFNGTTINAMAVDKSNNVWIGTNRGLSMYNKRKKTFIYYEAWINTKNSLSNNSVNSIYCDNQHRIWVATNLGLNCLDKKGNIKQYLFTPNDKNSLIHNTVRDITQNRSGALVIGTLGGLSVLDANTGTFSNYKSHYFSENSLNNDFINCILRDRDGNIWIGTEKGGVNVLEEIQKGFECVVREPDNNNTLSHNTINSVFEDEESIWIGTAGGGLNQYIKKTGKFVVCKSDLKNPQSISGNFITGILRDKNNQLWVATWGDGLNLLKQNNTFIKYKQTGDEGNRLSSDFISSMIEDKSGRIWLGSMSGLDVLNPDTKKIHHFTSRNSTEQITTAGCLAIDNQSNIWVGAPSGLFKISTIYGNIINNENSIIQVYKNNPEDLNRLCGNYIISIYCDSSHCVWVGTYGNGLIKIERDKKTGKEIFKNYLEKDGLCNLVVYGILEDNLKNIWLSTDNGLSKFNPKKEVFRNYFTTDGLLSNQFYWTATFKNKQGKLYFGGMNGLNMFLPENITEDKSFPEPTITDIKIYNHSIKVGEEIEGDVILDKAILFKEELVLSYKIREFSLEFSSLNISQPDKCRFKYKLQGYDNHWTEVDSKRRFASYTNLKQGDFIFTLYTTNSDGIWNENPLLFHIKIIPPIWSTWWFKLLLAIVLVGAIIGYNALRIKNLRMQKEKLEIVVKHRTAFIEKQKEELANQAQHLLHSNEKLEKSRQKVSEQKENLESQNSEILAQRDKLMELNKKIQMVNHQQMNFFTYISHEFRTPLTLILAPVGKLLNTSNLSEIVKNDIQLIQKNAQRLLQLINQLMEIRKTESGKMELKVQQDNIVEFISRVSQSFESLAIQRNTKINILANPPEITVYFDKDIIENIVYNILANSLKYSNENTFINVSISLQKNINYENAVSIIDNHIYKTQNINEYVEIRIKDQGIGIATEQIKDIFRRFYRVNNSFARKVKGTGIGLYLTKELLKTHHGLLFVSSELNIGTEMIVLIPATDNYFAPNQQISNEPLTIETDEKVKVLETQFITNEMHELDSLQNNKQEKNKASILVIEDDMELNKFICNNLATKYKIFRAEDGQKGLEIATKYIPDLIISDVMMPKMDGLELCTNLKTKIPTSHIPVILLSARSEIEHRIEGLETGADDYVAKPFNTLLLEAKVRSLLENRKRLRKIFSNSLVPVPTEITTTKPDEEFIQRALAVVEKNIDNSEFSIQDLANEMCMSKSLLHKKLTSITGESPLDFITTIRLKKSIVLMLENQLNITEISYSVGFNDPKYFSRCFRKHLGKSPSDYLRDIKTTN